jgi:glycosyltransferase involved in cell wall biosynthesis
MKQQLETVRAFADVSSRLPGWELWCVGGLGADDEHYFAEVTALANSVPGVRLSPNATRAEVEQALAVARVFWHLVGLGVDEQKEPWRLEHFGIATVEAMAAGCVPIVLDRGGQKEIVEQRVSGILCGSVAEMLDATVELANDTRLYHQLSAAAEARATEFSLDRFTDRLRNLINGRRDYA